MIRIFLNFQWRFWYCVWTQVENDYKSMLCGVILLLYCFQLLESEAIAENCRSRMLEQGEPFYRFSPQLPEVIPAGETNLESLVNMHY